MSRLQLPFSNHPIQRPNHFDQRSRCMRFILRHHQIAPVNSKLHSNMFRRHFVSIPDIKSQLLRLLRRLEGKQWGIPALSTVWGLTLTMTGISTERGVGWSKMAIIKMSRVMTVASLKTAQTALVGTARSISMHIISHRHRAKSIHRKSGITCLHHQVQEQIVRSRRFG
jgi:hypothetical protein